MKRLPVTGGVALLDDEDYERFRRFRWHLNRGWVQRTYRRADGSVRSVKMHREVCGLEPGDPREADHINRDRADNRRANLRITTHAENTHNLSVARNNTSGHRGVSWNARTRKWQVEVDVGRQRHYLGRFTNLEEAATVAREGRARLMSHAHD